VYNIGNNQPVELMHLIETLEHCLGRRAKKNLLPLQLGDVPATFADVDDLIRDVGFKPATPIEEGVERFVQWYRWYHHDDCDIPQQTENRPSQFRWPADTTPRGGILREVTSPIRETNPPSC
jgi:dTDP-D-glucose 4,6-dehydratase